LEKYDSQKKENKKIALWLQQLQYHSLLNPYFYILDTLLNTPKTTVSVATFSIQTKPLRGPNDYM
jgi:hypothetical protein